MSNDIRGIVQERCGRVAEGNLSSKVAGGRAVGRAFGYSAEELASIPAEVNIGLSCGNPTAIVSLPPLRRFWSIAWFSFSHPENEGE